MQNSEPNVDEIDMDHNPAYGDHEVKQVGGMWTSLSVLWRSICPYIIILLYRYILTNAAMFRIQNCTVYS